MQKLYHSHKVLFSVLGAFFIIVFLFLKPLYPYVPTTLTLVKDFISADVTSLRSTDGKTNILLLGLGGPKNEPAGLTDTIIFSSVNHSGDQTLLLSLPRDIWIPEMQAKLNAAYYYGNRAEGLGIEWARDFIEEITGQPVHYVVVLSFDGFREVIDVLGGVEVDVEAGFTDERYPVPGRENDECGDDPEFLCRYEAVSFEQGLRHFDGEQALKFARSRNAIGAEGTDFARSARQQKIIFAIKKKAFSPRVFLNPQKVDRLLEISGQSVETDIPQSHFAPFAKLALKVRKTELRSEVLNGLLINPPISQEYGFQWVLVPRAGSWEEVHEWVNEQTSF